MNSLLNSVLSRCHFVLRDKNTGNMNIFTSISNNGKYFYQKYNALKNTIKLKSVLINSDKFNKILSDTNKELLYPNQIIDSKDVL